MAITSLSMELTQQIASVVNESVEPINREMAVQTEILRRVEANVVKTNGRVTELERWRIESEAKAGILKSQSRRAAQYYGPIISGIAVGLVLTLVKLVLHR